MGNKQMREGFSDSAATMLPGSKETSSHLSLGIAQGVLETPGNCSLPFLSLAFSWRARNHGKNS